MSEMSVHEPGAEWLTPRDVDRDVASLAPVLPHCWSEGGEASQGKRPSRISMHAIRKVTQRIADRFQPEKIILFGSYAYGHPKPESDVDLLVIMDTPLRSRQQRLEISRALSPRPFPLDVIVRTPRELAERIALGDLFLQEITTRGKVLYERNRVRVG
jgi:predicted nucleotidyltransferase